MAAHVCLHGSQAGAAGSAQRAAVGCSPVCPEVLGHGREVPRALRTEAAGEGLLSYGGWRRRLVKEGRGKAGLGVQPGNGQGSCVGARHAERDFGASRPVLREKQTTYIG